MCGELKGQSNPLLWQGQVPVQEVFVVQGVFVVRRVEHEKSPMEVLEVSKLVHEMVQMVQWAQVLTRKQVAGVLLRWHLLPFLLEEM